ncbi:hypothetical protein B0H63DRAFT_524683 [Podospora didyma]|uniref:Uncharacterized protein n=1 Tax=Podospora didyma TaxID=330526 RepID=A0AAE0NID2_9PEZI|nr:hypothetical protein B0H63DRAFT_524683 [Podospora didyma]
MAKAERVDLYQLSNLVFQKKLSEHHPTAMPQAWKMAGDEDKKKGDKSGAQSSGDGNTGTHGSGTQEEPQQEARQDKNKRKKKQKAKVPERPASDSDHLGFYNKAQQLSVPNRGVGTGSCQQPGSKLEKPPGMRVATRAQKRRASAPLTPLKPSKRWTADKTAVNLSDLGDEIAVEAAGADTQSDPELEDDPSDFDSVFGDDLHSELEAASPARLTKTLQTTGGLANEIHDFNLQLKRQLEKQAYGEALVDVSRFKTLTDNVWDTHDPVIDILWNQLVAQAQDIMGSSFPIKHMVKPSGPMKAIYHILWHYPTFCIDKEDYGNVMDPSNPSLMVQLTKIGTPRTVRTADFIPMRHEMVYSKKSVA